MTATLPSPALRATVPPVFAAALSLLVKTVPTRASAPILNNVHLRSDGRRLIATTTDVESQISVDLPIDGASFATTVDAKRLLSFVKDATQPIDLDYDGVSLRVRVGSASGMLATLPPDDFPIKSGDASNDAFRLPAELHAYRCDFATVRDALVAAQPFGQKPDRWGSRNASFGALALDLQADRLYACDGYSLIELPSPIVDDGYRSVARIEPVLIPLHVASLLRAVKFAGFTTPYATTTMYGRSQASENANQPPSVTASHIGFTVPFNGADEEAHMQVQILSRLIDATPPDYRSIIPHTPTGHDFFVNAAALREIVDAAHAFTQHRKPWLFLETTDPFGEREVDLRVKLVEDGIEFERHIGMQAHHYNGPTNLALNPQRFRDALRAFGKAHGHVELHLSGPLSPVVLRSLNTGKVPIVTVVTMPIRT